MSTVKLALAIVVLAALAIGAKIGWRKYNEEKHRTYEVQQVIGQFEALKGSPEEPVKQLLNLIGNEDSVAAVVDKLSLEEHFELNREDTIFTIRGRLGAKMANGEDEKIIVVITYRDGDVEKAKEILASLIEVYNIKLMNTIKQQQGQQPVPQVAE